MQLLASKEACGGEDWSEKFDIEQDSVRVHGYDTVIDSQLVSTKWNLADMMTKAILGGEVHGIYGLTSCSPAVQVEEIGFWERAVRESR